MHKDIKVIEAGKIYEILNLIYRRWDILLTSKSISALQNYLNGYLQVNHGDNIYREGEPSIDEFKYFILSKDKRKLGLSNPYSTVLLNECNGNEEKAFEKFFEYLEAFKMEKNSC